MKTETIVPEGLRVAYSQFAALQDEAEKEAFLKEMAGGGLNLAPGVLDQHLRDGLNALSDRVDVLLSQVKQPA
jgi:hypothetical protein